MKQKTFKTLELDLDGMISATADVTVYEDTHSRENPPEPPRLEGLHVEAHLEGESFDITSMVPDKVLDKLQDKFFAMACDEVNDFGFSDYEE